MKKAYIALSKVSDANTVIDGFKDKSILAVLPYWNIVDMDVLDAMHQVQGIVKHLCSLWSKSEYKTFAFNWTKKHWYEFDNLYKSQRICSIFNRNFRSVKDHSLYKGFRRCLSKEVSSKFVFASWAGFTMIGDLSAGCTAMISLH